MASEAPLERKYSRYRPYAKKIETRNKMRTLGTVTKLGLIGLFALYGVVANGQPNNSDNNVKNELTGIWGMFKDKHPDGWGSFNPPYMYVEFTGDNKYNRIWLHRKGNSMIFGEYDVVGDSLIIFHESVGTNGIEKGIVKADTVKLSSIKSDLLEIWEDWDRILWKSIKKWGHKQKYRPLTNVEKEELVAVKTQLMNDYSLIKDTVEKKDN